MNKTVHIFILSILLVFGLSSTARAADEQATIGLEVEPVGALYKESFRPASWGLTTLISTTSPSIFPLRVATIQLGGNTAFRPSSSMPVCPDSQIGPGVNISAPVDTIIARCPQSVIGNGTALFQLAGINGEFYQRQGYIVIFNGGRDQSGNPKIKVYAYSYATAAAVYTESVLDAGQLSFAVPRLSFDSAVTSLNLNIPGEVIPVTDPAAPEGTTIPTGQDPNYVGVRCPADSWTASGEFLLGNRNSAEQPVPPEVTVSDSTSLPCQGDAGQARVSKPQVSGPSKLKVGATGKFRVKLSNRGTATARALKIRVLGPGISMTKSIGSLGPEKTKTVTVKVQARKPGQQSWKFQALSANSAKVSATKRVAVKKR